MSTPPNENSPRWGNPGQSGNDVPGNSGNPSYPPGPQTPGDPYAGQPRIDQPEPGQSGAYQSGAYPSEGNQPSKFGTEAYHPGAGYGAPMEEPQKFQTLKTVTLASLGVYLLSQIVGFMTMFSPESEQIVRDQFATMGMSATQDDIEAALLFSAGLVVVMSVIAVALYLLVYFGLRAKKNWARITGIVLTILGTVLTLGGLLIDATTYATGMGLVALALTVAWVAVNIYWLMLAFNGQVKAYLTQFRR